MRLGISSHDAAPSLEIVLPVLQGDMRGIWSKGKSHFKLGIEYTIGKHGPTMQFFTNPVGLHDTTEILNILTIFHRKIKTYSTIK